MLLCLYNSWHLQFCLNCWSRILLLELKVSEWSKQCSHLQDTHAHHATLRVRYYLLFGVCIFRILPDFPIASWLLAPPKVKVVTFALPRHIPVYLASGEVCFCICCSRKCSCHHPAVSLAAHAFGVQKLFAASLWKKCRGATGGADNCRTTVNHLYRWEMCLLPIDIFAGLMRWHRWPNHAQSMNGWAKTVCTGGPKPRREGDLLRRPVWIWFIHERSCISKEWEFDKVTVLRTGVFHPIPFIGQLEGKKQTPKPMQFAQPLNWKSNWNGLCTSQHPLIWNKLK